jgi:hypothetical protein
MKIMESKNTHKVVNQNYAISRYLKIPYAEVCKISRPEKEHMYNVVKSSLETGRDPRDVMSANYKTSKAKLFTTENNEGTDISFKDQKISNVLNEVEVEVVFDTLTFKPNYDSNSTFGFNIEDTQSVYVKTNDKIDDITKNDLIYIEIFNRMYQVVNSRLIEAYELDGKYYMLKIQKYQKFYGAQSA